MLCVLLEFAKISLIKSAASVFLLKLAERGKNQSVRWAHAERRGGYSERRLGTEESSPARAGWMLSPRRLG